jgi:hypothetical protein
VCNSKDTLSVVVAGVDFLTSMQPKDGPAYQGAALTALRKHLLSRFRLILYWNRLSFAYTHVFAYNFRHPTKKGIVTVQHSVKDLYCR